MDFRCGVGEESLLRHILMFREAHMALEMKNILCAV